MTLRAVGSSVPPGRSAPYILAQSAVPVCLAPNGTVATNGVVTLGTALPTTYSGGIWLRLPANAVVGGLAGLYWAVMTSTTQGQVFTNFADPATEFIPFIPSAPLVNAVGSNAAYTQTQSIDVALTNITLPANTLGITGSFVSTLISATGGTTAIKSVKTNFGGQAICSRSFSTALNFFSHQANVRNRGLANRQVSYRLGGGSYTEDSLGSMNYTTAATSGDVAISHMAQMAASGAEFVILEGFAVEVRPS